MVKTNKKLRKTLDTMYCYHLCKKGISTNQYRFRGKLYSMPLPLLKKVESMAEEAGDETVMENAGDAFAFGFLSGTGIMEYEND